VPELPEVETIVRELRPRLLGLRITKTRIGKKTLRRSAGLNWVPHLTGKRIVSLSRRGKWIVIRLEEDLILLFHLGMTGQLTIAASEQPALPHTHLIADLQTRSHRTARNKWQLRFRDIRRFGCIVIFPDELRLDDFFRNSGLGPEPFNLDPSYWRACLARTRRSLKAVLLDQRVLAGVGNIYSDEALFEARLHPNKTGRTVRSQEAARLQRAITTVLKRAIEKRGSSIRDYVSGNGQQGEYQDEFRVYGRAGKPCPRCRGSIRRIRLAGRSTHYCPGCQRQS
jgi:formamidopyrimidine-DNA glycosylase